MDKKKCSFNYWSVILFLLLVLFSAGCARKGKSLDQDIYVPIEEEHIDLTYTPRDDGKPLTDNELKAFRSLGEIDKNMSQEDTSIVELHFKYFVHEHRKTFERFLARTARYLPYMKKVFNERGIPEELVYIAMAESGGNPNAISRAGAVGLWQFMRVAGKRYGLTQNAWIDERRDPYKATYAASDYLLKLQNDFKDWHLAMAAYNAGEGKIGRALSRTGASSFFDLCRLDDKLTERARLRNETRNYVPRVLAIAKIMRNLQLLGFEPPSPLSTFNLTEVKMPHGTNLSGFVRAIGLTWDEFQSMNPAFRRTATPPNAESSAYLPASYVAAATAWLSSPDAKAYAGWKDYSIRRRDTLVSIAKRFRVTQKAIKEANGFSRLPKVGSSIIIPAGSSNVEPVYMAQADKLNPATKAIGKYTVVVGDTLFILAQRWGTDVRSIRLVNRLGSRDSLSIGQRLSIPGNSSKRQAVSKGASYIIKKGDTLSSIALKHGVTTQELCILNDIDIRTRLVPGQSISLSDGSSPKPVTTPSNPASVVNLKNVSSGKVEKIVTIKAGDTLFTIAKRNRVSVHALCKANGLNLKSVLRLGRKLIIP